MQRDIRYERNLISILFRSVKIIYSSEKRN